MKTYTFLLLVIFLSNSLIAQVLSSTSEDKKHGEEYYPFNENTELIFDSNIGESKKSVTILDGLYKTTNVSDKFIYSLTLKKEKDGIYIVRTEQKINTFLYSKEVDITYSKPLLHIPLPLKIGETWNWSGFQIKNGDTTEVSISGEAIGNELVELPIGEFNTLKIKIFIAEKDGEETTLYYWLAPGIGSIKTKVIIEGKGIIQFAMSLLGYDEIDSELKEIIYLK